MKFHIFLSLSVLFSTCSAQTCSSENRDCSCKDVSYEICHTPPAAQESHVNNLEECIQNCDLFGSFGQCNYLLFWGESNAPDENCKLIVDTTVDQYLDACRVVGQPLRDAYGQCVQGLESDTCSYIGCDTGCHTCDVNDACGLYAETECQKEGSPGETSVNIPDYATCLSLCTSQQQSNPFTYAVYDKESQECICYPDGLRSCQITVVPYGMSMNQVEHCDGCTTDADCTPPLSQCSILTGRCVECETNADCTDPTKPICNTDINVCEADLCSTCSAPTAACDPVTGACVECVDDSDCSDPKPICDLADNVCKPECTKDADCNPEDYCQCIAQFSTDDCSDGGHCVLGCRNVGDACQISAGVNGNCNGNHECVQSGGSKLSKITIETRGECTGCPGYRVPSGVAGATIMMSTDSVSGTVTCSTNILDHTSDIDYAGKHNFDDYDTLGECFMFALSDLVTDFSVTWTGPGAWTPEKFILERENQSTWPYCCYNDAGLTVSEGQSQTFTCSAADSSIGLNC